MRVTGNGMRKANTAISEVKINGTLRYRVTFPTANGRKREHYVDRKRAETRLKEIKEEQKRFGLSVTAMTSTTRADAVAAEKILAGTGLTLVEIARAAVEQKRKTESGIPIREGVDAFLQGRADRSANYLRTLRPRLEYVAAFFAGRTTASIGAADCQRLLDGLAGMHSRQTVAHYRTHLSGLLEFWKGRGWIFDNPVKKKGGRKAEPTIPEKDIKILTPAEANAVLSGCDPEILPGVVLGMFCGLRKAEIERIQWSAVDLKQGQVTIGAGIAKTGSRRVCPVADCAKAWLAAHARESGNVWPVDHTKARDLWTLARVRAGYGPFFTDFPPARDAQLDPKTKARRKDLKPWPANALRHSAISYRVAQEKDLAKIAYESGNSPGIIRRHYNGLASPDAAKAFFAIMPTVAENVRQFKAA
jgi:integrase